MLTNEEADVQREHSNENHRFQSHKQRTDF